MKGYCGDPAATQAAIRDGWMHTGDLGYFDPDGFIHIVDRLKNIVISGGENISCAEVERVAMTHPDVEEAAGFGVTDDRLGERLVLAVVPRPGKSLDEEALKAHIGAALAIFKVPRQMIQVERLPRNHMEKIDRNALKRQFLN
jgi:long-chain acyl-CoA synthetase